MNIPLYYLSRSAVAKALTLRYTLFIWGTLLAKFWQDPFGAIHSQQYTGMSRPEPLTDEIYGVHKYVEVNDVKLHYVESGDPCKPMMLFLHGFPEFWYSWRHQIVHYNKNYWCIALDMRGYGDSEKPEEVEAYSMELLVQDVQQVIEKLGRKKCILISHDWGGIVAAKFRDLYPDYLLGYVSFASSSIEAGLEGLWNDPKQMESSWYIFFHQTRMIPEYYYYMNCKDLFQQYLMVEGRDTVTETDLECYEYMFCRKPTDWSPAVNYYRANLDTGLYIPEKPMDTRYVPMLMVRGGDDMWLSGSLQEIMKKEYKYIDTGVAQNCSHFFIQQQPEIANKFVDDFLEKYNL